ncbi:25.3 kDa vesicle transport protein isoform X1 [Andrographis paniculata]|uniref:25.3 kDa vesicle transport protein isoform X1 n=1 Tax=Andrographis paniculata TaxID=175694 RepID=UPI0021E8A65C|nr:25.3 kDa vesicle transport protein isoform X1 [Andrographis paniculata]
MVRLTIVGRVSDGMPLARGARYVNEGSDDVLSYNEKGEFLLREISRGALPSSRMTIFLDQYYFNYLVDNGICFMGLCDALYPRRLAFHYLQDLQREFSKFDVKLTERIIKPYSFVKFDGVIGNIRRKYIDTRTQANIAKINSDSFIEDNVASESFSQVVKQREQFGMDFIDLCKLSLVMSNLFDEKFFLLLLLWTEMFERMSKAHLHPSPIWCSKTLEVFAVKWMPLGLMVAVIFVLVTCTSLPRFFTGFHNV